MRGTEMMKKRWVKAAAAVGIMGILAVGGTVAYLTDYDNTVNEFTVGKVDIELNEPSWKPDENTKIEPTQVITKDPQVKNTGVNDAFVYLEVSIPMADVIAAQEDGTRLEKGEQELFSFAAKTDWTRLETRTVKKNKVYVYAYNKVLKPGETSTSLFDSVTFLNMIEGQLDTQQLDIPVRAYAIQTANTGGDTGSVVEQAKAAYTKYVNQNSGQDGAVTR